MASLSIRVMAHRKREEYIPHLVDSLGITADDVVWDTRGDRWDTGRRAWQAVDKDADWGCVIQDDAIVCADFSASLARALDVIDPTGAIVSPYTGTRRPSAHKVEDAVREATAEGASWIRMPSLNWGVAIVLPTGIIDGMLPWCDKQRYPNYDRRIGRYVIDRLGMDTMCTWPSLVDHRECPSLVGHGAGRTAHGFIGETSSAVHVDWSGPVVDMGNLSRAPMVARYRARRTAVPLPSSSPPPVTTVDRVTGTSVPARHLRSRRRGPDGQWTDIPARPGV